MRLETEYFMRTGFFQENLEFPCSLFLVNLWDSLLYKVITIEPPHENGNVVVKQWEIDNVDKDSFLPPVKYSVIEASEIYHSNSTVIKDYKPIDYTYLDYQYTFPPSDADINWHAAEQKSYQRFVKSRYFSDTHCQQREIALWYCFINSYLPITCGDLRKGCDFESQQQIVKECSSFGWEKWLTWRRYLLDFHGKIAPELSFQKSYSNKIAMNEEYQEMIRNKSTAKLYYDDIDFPT